MVVSNFYYEKDAENLELNNEIKELTRQVNRLTRQNNYLESEIDAMKNSNSWKMTEPLRNLKRKM